MMRRDENDSTRRFWILGGDLSDETFSLVPRPSVVGRTSGGLEKT